MFLSNSATKEKVIKQFLIYFVCVFSLFACGGGSSDSSIPESQNSPPTSNAGPDQNVNENTQVQLSASASDAQGNVTQVWAQVSGPSIQLSSQSILNPTFQSPQVDSDATIVLEITVTDSDGATAVDSVTIMVANVEATNTLPTVDVGLDQSVDENTLVQLAASANDAEGEVTQNWVQLSGPSIQLSNQSILNPTFQSPQVDSDATIVLEITVTDSDGATAVNSVTIMVANVEAMNTLPTVDAGIDQNVDENTLVQLAASASDAEGEVTQNWVQLSGPSIQLSSQSILNPTFQSPQVDSDATIVLEITVTDDQGAMTADTLSIMVSNVEVPNALPTVDAGNDIEASAQSQVVLSASTDDPDGNITGVQWRQTSGPSVVLINDSSTSASFEAPSVSVNTELVFEITVTDNQQATAIDSITVTVVPFSSLITITGSKAPGLQEGFNFTRVTEYSIGSDGNVAIIADATNQSNQTVEGVWYGQPSNLTLITKSEDNVPTFEQNVVIEGIGGLVSNGSGEVLFSARLQGAIADLERGILLHYDNTGLRVVKPSLPESLVEQGYIFLSSPADYKVSNYGSVVTFNISRAGPLAASPLGHATWLYKDREFTLIQGSYLDDISSNTNSANDFQTSVSQLYPDTCNLFPIYTNVVNFVTGPLINDQGDIAIQNNMRSVIRDPLCPSNSIIKWKNGTSEISIANGDQVPNMTGENFELVNPGFPSSLALTQSGEVAFESTVGPSIFDNTNFLFVAKENGAKEFIFGEQESFQNDPSSSLVVQAQTYIAFSRKHGFIVEALELTFNQLALLIGESIDSPYEQRAPLGESHLRAVIRSGDIPDGFEAKDLYIAATDDAFVITSVNASGNIAFYALVADTFSNGQAIGGGLWGISNDGNDSNIIKLGDEFTDNDFGRSTLASIYGFKLLDNNQILALVATNNSSFTFLSVDSTLD